jgi:hypothetical protein
VRIETLLQFRIAVLLQTQSLTIEDMGEQLDDVFGESVSDLKGVLARMERGGMIRRGYTELEQNGHKGRLRSEFCLTVKMRMALGRELQTALDYRMQAV